MGTKLPDVLVFPLKSNLEQLLELHQNTLNGRKAYFYDALNGGFAFDMGSLVKSQPITASKSHSFDSLLGGNTILRHQRENGFSFISDKSQGDSVEGSMMAFLPVSPTTTTFVAKTSCRMRCLYTARCK